MSEHARERLDWQGFLARFHPGSRRHDFDVLAAYESYLNDADHRPADGFPKLGSSSSAIRAARSNSTRRFENEDEAPATADTNRWEGDGGAPAPRPRSAHTDTMVVRGRRRRGAPGLQL